jgi:hypothetical protein
MTGRLCSGICRQKVGLFYVVFFVALSQACAANENSTKNVQANKNQASQNQELKMDTEQTTAASSASSRYKPTGLLLRIDFEKEEVKPLTDKHGGYDQLVLNSASGDAAAIGIMYEGGKDSDRHARISADPKNAQNRVLHYWLKNARAPGQRQGRFKGRIQLGLSNLNMASFFQRFRLYLHPDLNIYRQFPGGNGWFTINELWMGARWEGHPFPFRMGVNIAKPAGVGRPLYFIASGDVSTGGPIRNGTWKQVWMELGSPFEVPVGEWIDIEIGYKQGDEKSGRFYMGAKRQQDKQFTTVFDVTNWTYHPDSPEPVALTNWQPLKLYTGSTIIDYIRKNAGVTQLYWDDLEIYGNW